MGLDESISNVYCIDVLMLRVWRVKYWKLLKGGNCNIRYARAMVVIGLFNNDHMIFIINNI